MKERSLDDPGIFELDRTTILAKPFLQRIYTEWYNLITDHLPSGEGAVVEIGSGAGFLEAFIPDLITSDVQFRTGVSSVFAAQHLPFADQELKAIVMLNVLHHIPSARSFLESATRCIRRGGVILMIEPWVTRWSTFIYRRFHHEPFMPEAPDWGFAAGGPLSSANGALPWIIFHRDRRKFEERFVEWRIGDIRPLMPTRYILSGGVSRRGLVPSSSFGIFSRIDEFLNKWPDVFPMFAFIKLEKSL